MRRWKNYRHTQLYSECQLISALNALYYLKGLAGPSMGSNEYEALVDLIKARSGASLCVNLAHEKFGLSIISKFDREGLLEIIHDPPLPLEVSIWTQQYGHHSILIVDKNPGCLRVTNLNKILKENMGWINIATFIKFIPNFPNCQPTAKLLGVK